MSVVVELVGGPLDGAKVALDVKPWCPPLSLLFPRPTPVSAIPTPVLDTSLPVEWVVYDRRRSPSEDGPVWRYVYRRTE